MKISLNQGGVDMVRLLALIAFPVMALAQPPLVPLLWTQGQSPETIRQVVREVADGGNTGFVWESRPHPDYLGPRWWADLRVAVDEAKRLKLEVWIFDEWMYPSGVAGGKGWARSIRSSPSTRWRSVPLSYKDPRQKEIGRFRRPWPPTNRWFPSSHSPNPRDPARTPLFCRAARASDGPLRTGAGGSVGRSRARTRRGPDGA